MRQVARQRRRRHLLAGETEQQVPLTRGQCGKDVARDRVEHRRAGHQPLGVSNGVSSSRDRPSGKHDGGAPTVRASGDRGTDFGRIRPCVPGDQGGGLVVAQAEQVPAQDGEIPTQLGGQASKREVPATDQQKVHAAWLVVEPSFDVGDNRPGQRVGVIDHQELWLPVCPGLG